MFHPVVGRGFLYSSDRLRCFLGSALALFCAASAIALPPILPAIPPGTNNILNFGAVGDGVTTNTTAIQNAINNASAGGIGTVEVPAGTFLSGPLTFGNSLNLQLDSGATLLMLPFTNYPGGDI